MTVMLLGSAQDQPLEFRKRVRDELVEMGFRNIIIMEESADREYEDISLDGKLRRIISVSNPDLFVAFFHKDARMDGVIFELGWLCCKFSTIGINEKLRIFFDQSFDWNAITSYISSLSVHVQSAAPLDESNPYRKASTQVKNTILEIYLRRLSRDFSL